MLKGTYTGLRAIDPEDLEQLLEWRNLPEFRRFFREYRELGRLHQKKWFEETIMGNNSVVMFAIEDLASGRLMGACGLYYIDWVNRNADFSIYIGSDRLYIDALYAPDAAATLIRYGFEELGLHRLWAEIYDFDHAKKKFFTDLGFTLDGTHRQTHWAEGKWHDSLYVSLLIHEYITLFRGKGEQGTL